jgi:AcrR family transcriptional regulator
MRFNQAQPPEEANGNGATRQRLLDTAGEIFAAHGFRGATVREICRKAGANVAAVNYHFGGKAGLYAEVLRFAHTCAMTKYPPDMGLKPKASARERLHAFVRSFLFRVLDKGRPAWHGKLMAREIADPTGALESIVKDGVRPHFAALRAVVTDLLPPRVADDADVVRYAAWSVVAQCLYYFYARPVILQLHPSQGLEGDAVEEIATHITDFSLAALRGYRKEGAKSSS